MSSEFLYNAYILGCTVSIPDAEIRIQPIGRSEQNHVYAELLEHAIKHEIQLGPLEIRMNGLGCVQFNNSPLRWTSIELTDCVIDQQICLN